MTSPAHPLTEDELMKLFSKDAIPRLLSTVRAQREGSAELGITFADLLTLTNKEPTDER